MPLWVVRAGKHGENETYALDGGCVTVGWEDLGDLSRYTEREKLDQHIVQSYPSEKVTTTRVWTGELWALRERIAEGDLVALPLKSRSAVALGKIAGPYRFDPAAPYDAKHQRPVTWMRTDIPRSEIDQDILFSLGSTLTVFQVRRDDAEQRLLALARGQRPPARESGAARLIEPTVEDEPIDVEEYTRDQITAFIGRKFKGHDLARLVAGVLTAESYKVELSPPGADGGVDIIAGQGAMGFDPPRLIVQVKSSDAPVDVGVLRELQGVMPSFGGDRGLIVAWGGFRTSVIREARRLFFSIRLWDAGDLVRAIQDNYDRLPPDLKAEIPLRQLWALTLDE